jgi:hypothetical protein
MLRLLPLVLCSFIAAAQDYRLVIVDPGHFHASLVQKDMYPFLSPRVSVYANLSPELADYLNRIALFNARRDNPTHWDVDVHTGADFFARMLREKAGNVAMFTGRNRVKIDRIQASLDAGYRVLADKPWIVTADQMPKLDRALGDAERKGLAAYDIMTERFEISSLVQRELVNTPAVFGTQEKGTPEAPAIRARSVHHIMKLVAGVPLKRPAWFFDIREAGEALADVGTHVVDQVQWIAFPDKVLDWRHDVHVLSGRHWATPLTQAQFRQVTGEPDFPAALAPAVKDGRLDYVANNRVNYTLRGVNVALDILWNWEAAAGAGDVYEASFQGTRARVELRQEKTENHQLEVYVVPVGSPAEVFAALRQAVAGWQQRWPGTRVEVNGGEARIVIPAKFRVGHESHFSQVTNLFFTYVRDPKKMPAWERAAMLTKYYVTTKGVEAAQSARP